MSKKLAILVLGKQNSGKSSVWKTLFGFHPKMIKNPKYLVLNSKQTIHTELAVKSSSPYESGVSIMKFLSKLNFDPYIVLCSVGYYKKEKETMDYFATREEYDVYVFWLNPGKRDDVEYEDNLNLVADIHDVDLDNVIKYRNQNENDKKQIAKEIRETILNWVIENP